MMVPGWWSLMRVVRKLFQVLYLLIQIQELTRRRVRLGGGPAHSELDLPTG